MPLHTAGSRIEILEQPGSIEGHQQVGLLGGVADGRVLHRRMEHEVGSVAAEVCLATK